MKKIQQKKKIKIVSDKKTKNKKYIQKSNVNENVYLNEFISFKSIKLPEFKKLKNYYYDTLSKNIFQKMMASWEKYSRILNINPNKPKLSDFYDWLSDVYKMHNDFILQIKININNYPIFLKRALKDFPDFTLSPEQLSNIFEQILIMEKKYILSKGKYNPSERKKEIINYNDVVSIIGSSDKNQKKHSEHEQNIDNKKNENNMQYFLKNFVTSSNIPDDKKIKILDKLQNNSKEYIENILNFMISKI